MMTPDEIVAIARAVVDKSARETPRPQMIPGTVKQFHPAPQGRGMPTAEVRMTGDGEDRTIGVTVVSGVVSPGQVVMVQFIEQQAVTWGAPPVVTPVIPDVVLMLDQFYDDTSITTSTPWVAPADLTITAIRASLQNANLYGIPYDLHFYVLKNEVLYPGETADQICAGLIEPLPDTIASILVPETPPDTTGGAVTVPVSVPLTIGDYVFATMCEGGEFIGTITLSFGSP